MVWRTPGPRAGRAIGLALGLVLALSRGVAAEVEDAAPPSAQQVVARTFANLYGFHSVQRLEVRARDRDGRDFRRTCQVVRRGVADSELNRSLVRLTSPEDVRGMGLLMIERPDYSYDAFLYQPAFRRVRRITVAQRQQTFFGTDIALEDLEAKRPSQWPARFLRAEAVGERSAWVLELVPRDVETEYERVVGWFDRALPILLRAEFYRDGERLKTFEIDPERVREIDGYHVPLVQRFRGERGSVTEIETSSIEMRDEVPDKIFTATALEFGHERWAEQQ